MYRIFISLIIGFIGLPFSSAQSYHKIVIDQDIFLIPLQDSIFIHETWHTFEEFGRFPSNGMIIIKNGEVLMIDTPIDNDKTKRLVTYLNDSLKVKVKTLIIGHFHDDCLGGLAYLKSTGVSSIANSMTVEKCKALNLPLPSNAFTDSLTFYFNGLQIDCCYFGAGHAPDNITVWLPHSKILFGGCLVKSAHAKSLGNLSDAVVENWSATIESISSAYPNIKTVIPGHGKYGDTQLLHYTIELVKAELRK